MKIKYAVRLGLRSNGNDEAVVVSLRLMTIEERYL